MINAANQAPEICSGVDWERVTKDLHGQGYALAPSVLPDDVCDDFIAGYDDDFYRKTVIMARHRFGLGEYKYFDYPLPAMVRQARDEIYERLASVANEWAAMLAIDAHYPKTHAEFLKHCHDAGQLRPTPLILKYGEGGFNTLHQDLYGDVYFPIQLAFFLNEPGKDYTGGEFVLTEQTARAQSKAIVLTPRKGDMIVFTTNFRPVKGTRGYYRTNMRHGVSAVRSGERHTLGVIFHDALS